MCSGRGVAAGVRGPSVIEDLGDITTARATEALVLLVPHVLRRTGVRPFAVSLAR